MIRQIHPIFVCLLCAGLNAQTLEFPRAVVFGKVAADEVVAQEVLVENRGEQPLIISQLQVTCPCLRATMDRMRISPGEFGVMRVELNAERVSGRVERTVRVVSNASPGSHYLRVSAQVPVNRPKPKVRDKPDTAGWRAGEVLVRFCEPAKQAGKSARDLARNLACSDGVKVHRDSGLYCLVLHDDESVTEAILRLSKCDDVAYVQPNFRYGPRAAAPDDADFFRQWALENTGQAVGEQTGLVGADIQILDAWDLSTGAASGNGAIVAVLDNGVDYNHPDLSDRMWDGSACLDHNGDPLGDCIHGYDYSTGAGDKDPIAVASDHGTHVAGIIAATADNGIGIAGVAPDVQLMAVRSVDYSSSDFVKGIYFAAHNGATVINASWGFAVSGASGCQLIRDEGETSLEIGDRALYDAIADFPGMFVGAAGNTNRDHNGIDYFDSTDFGRDTACWDGLENVFSVGASDYNDAKWGSSDYGLYVDLLAPGVGIYSTSTNGNYSQKSGTSMSAPHAAGAAALLWSFRQDLTPGEVRELLLEYGECVATPEDYGTTERCAAGQGKRLNAYQPMAAAANPAISDLRGYLDSSQSEEIVDGGGTESAQPFWTWDVPTGQGIISHYAVKINNGVTYDGTVTQNQFNSGSFGLTFEPGPHRIEVMAVNDQGAVGSAAVHTWVESGLVLDMSPPASIGEGAVLEIPIHLIGGEDGHQPVSVNYLLLGTVVFEPFESTWAEGTVSWLEDEQGDKTVSIDLAPFGNEVDQSDGTLRFLLLGAVGAPVRSPLVRSIVLEDDDPAPGLAVADGANAGELGYVDFVVSLSERSALDVTFSYATIAGSATPGLDYGHVSGTSLIGAGQLETTISVGLLNDGLAEGREGFSLQLTEAEPVDPARSVLEAKGVIGDDDVLMQVEAPGWQTVALAISREGGGRSSVIPGAQVIWRWDTQARAYERVDSLRAYEGYFVYFFTTLHTVLEGTATAAPYPLKAGWNLVGTAASRQLPLDNPALFPTVYAQSADRQPATALEPGSTYWLFATRDTEIDLFSEE